MVTPTTWWPAAVSSAAAVELSTPPDMATSTRTPEGGVYRRGGPLSTHRRAGRAGRGGPLRAPHRDLEDHLAPAVVARQVGRLGAGRALHPDPAAVRLGDAPRHREPEAGAGRPGRLLPPGGGVVHRLEHRLLLRQRDAGPLVVDREPELPGRARHLHQHVGAV